MPSTLSGSTHYENIVMHSVYVSQRETCLMRLATKASSSGSWEKQTDGLEDKRGLKAFWTVRLKG